MKPGLTIYTAFLVILMLPAKKSSSQALTGYNFRIVNMIPNTQSNETTNDAETNIAVNPANTSMIVGSAFTSNPSGLLTTAPIFISSNGGTTWALNNILPSANGRTGDISVGFGSSSGTLFSGILRGGSFFRAMMLRTTTPTAATLMTTLVDRTTVVVDQPFVSATTVNDASSTPRERVFSGDNLVGSSTFSGGNGRTAEVMISNNAGSAAPAGFTNQLIEVGNTFGQDMPAIRTAIHNSGVVYAVFYRWTSGSVSPFTCDVIMTRDDNFATGTTPFNALLDAGNAQAGQRVVTGVQVPAAFFGAAVSLGSNRLVASNLAIAVDPGNSANVFVAWCDRVGTTDYTVHFRRSTNSGQTWGTADWLTVTNATNPGIAITTGGSVGLIYQQLTGTGTSTRWETHFRLAAVAGTTFTDDILSTFLDSDINTATVLAGFLGDYLRIQAVGNSFYGVFPAGNRAVSTNFPHNVTYQRNADFPTNQLRNLGNTANVGVSVDPFFFKISPIFVPICIRYPEICRWKYILPWIIRYPPYPCLRCPWPCLQCPPFEIPFEDIYKEAFKDKRPQTVLSTPYFHLFLDGYDPRNYDVVITTTEGESIKQQLNKTEKGYTISFRTSKNNFNAKEGIRGLKLLATPKNAEAAKKGATFNYRLEASDYQFKEFISIRK